MASIFDSDDFNDRLFFPSASSSPAPPGAIDLDIDVPGETLHLRWHRRDDAKATVLLFHGNGEVVADYDDTAPSFAALGAELAVVDYRGYGRSSGAPTLRNSMSDAAVVLQTLLAKCAQPIVVMGRSLGSACATTLYGSITHPAVAGYIIESGFVDLVALTHRRGMAATTPTAAEIETFDPVPKLRRGRGALLVLHGENDSLIVPAEAQAAFSAAGGSTKELVIVAGRGHNDISFSDQYWKAIGKFVSLITKSP